MVYPSHEVFVPGLFDLLKFQVSVDQQFVFFDFQFAALTNPFRAPEGYFHQRLELYITTGVNPGPGEIKLAATDCRQAQLPVGICASAQLPSVKASCTYGAVRIRSLRCTAAG